jgi:hypothetical protein
VGKEVTEDEVLLSAPDLSQLSVEQKEREKQRE